MALSLSHTHTHSYQFAERLTHSGLLPPTIQSLRKLDLASLARELHLRDETAPTTVTTATPSSPIQEGEDEDACSSAAASPVLASIGGIHGSPSSSCHSPHVGFDEAGEELLAGLVKRGVSKGLSSQGPSRASSVVTGATEVESPLSSPSSSSSDGSEGR